MKKIYTFILTCSFATNFFAQPVLNQSDFPSTTRYSLYVYTAADNILGLSPGSAGANQVWNFSAMKANFDGTLSVVPVVSTPYAADFPTANFAYKVTSDGYSDYYAYYNVSSTAFESLGSEQEDYTDILIDTNSIFRFPYTYQKSFTDSYRNAEDPIEGYTNTVTYDGYGQLITPYGVYNNVIRIKKVEEDDEGSYTDYEWYSTNPVKLVMAMGFYDNPTENQHGNYTTFLSSTQLNIKDNNKAKVISVYPNPTASILNLHLPNDKTIDKVVFIDVDGKVIKQETENTAQINVEKLAAGLYIIEIFSGSEKFTSKFIKK